MIAHLEGGRLGDARILEEATVETMHAMQVRHHSSLRGRAYGFSEWLENGQRALFYDGGMLGFTSRVVLLPEHRLGFAVAYNGDPFAPSAFLGRALTTAFLLDYFGPEGAPPPLTPPADFGDRAGRFAGTYRSLHEYSRNTLEKVVSLEEQVTVSDPGDGTLSAFGDTLVEVQPLLFRWRDGHTFVAFAANGSGQVERLFGGTAAYQKLPWYETRRFHLGLAVFFLVCFVAAPIAASAAFQAAAAGARPGGDVGAPQPRHADRVSSGHAEIDRWQFMYGSPRSSSPLLVLPVVAALLAAALLAVELRALRQGALSRFATVWCASLLGVELAFLAWLHYWNLLGFRT
jgi:hypothetical protein